MAKIYRTEPWSFGDQIDTEVDGRPATVTGPAGLGHWATAQAKDGWELVQVVPGAGSPDGARYLVIWAKDEAWQATRGINTGEA